MTTLNRSSAWLSRLALLVAAIGVAPACSDCNLSVSTQSLPDGVVDTSYSAGLNSHCGGDVWFLQTGELPPGIGLQDNGNLGGTPTIVGIFTFTVGVFDFGSGETAYRGLAIRVDVEAEPTQSQ